MRPPPPGSPAGLRGRTGGAPGDRPPPHRLGRRCGRARAASPLLSLPPRPPRPGAKPPALRRGAPLQRRFEEGRVPGLLPRAGVGGSGGRDALWGRDRGAGVPGSRPHPAGQAPRDPPGPGPLASRSPPVRCQPPPAAASRSSPPGPSAPFIFPRLRLGFCWFLGDKNRLK